MSASEKRDFNFPLPTHDDIAEGAFAAGSVAVQCPQLDPLGLCLERGGGYALRSIHGRSLSIDPEGEWLDRVALSPGQPVFDRTGFVFTLLDGVLQGRAAPPLRDRSIPGPRLDDPELSLPPTVRAAAQRATALGQGEVAAGLALRHGRAASVDVLIAGRDPIKASLHDWWDDLGEIGRADVSTRALRAAALIAETSDDLADEDAAEDAGWLADVAALCRSRDDLHSAARVLQRLAPASVPREALAAADLALRGLLRSVYLPLPQADPVMALAARQTACWWARSVATPMPDDPKVPDEDAP